MARESFKPSPADRVKIQVVESGDESVLVDLDGKNEPIIQVLDDRTDEEKQGTTRDPAKWGDENAQDPKGVSPRTQKRFDRLKAETETERRMRLETERQRDEAIRVATARETEINDLRRRLNDNTTTTANAMADARKTQITDATRRLEQAHAEGNSAEIAKATADLTRANAELVTIQANTPRAQAEQPRQVQQPERQVQQPANGPQLHPDTVAWIAANPKFNSDPEFRGTAVAIDNVLAAKGIRPGNPNYLAEVDKRMKLEYPDHQPFSGSQPDDDAEDGRTTTPRRTNAVVEGSRETRQPSGDPRTVVLTATEMAVAKSLGLTSPKQLAAYAAEKQRREQSGRGA